METALIDMYSKCGSMADAQRIFDATRVKDFLTWTALITGYARQGNTERVCYMLERMIEEGAQPDEVTFLSVLNACSHGGLVEQGQGFYKAMIQEYDMILTAKHQSCMVDLLGRAGQLNEAVAMLEKLRIKPDLVTWSAVLSGCQKWGGVDLAIQCT
jgi:pentatricopeptide repeat protein